uniref:Uncharacterized protein n=1 Tax=Onchocerca volvulus TaxID=6282 RepID=A0A8R1U139_ONCVO
MQIFVANIAFDCSSPDAQNAIYCLLGSTEVDSKDVYNIEAVRQLCSSRRRSIVFCRACGLFRFGRWLTPKEKRKKLWIANSFYWQHTTGTLNEKKNWLFYKLSNLNIISDEENWLLSEGKNFGRMRMEMTLWTRALEMVATISDEGALKFSLYLKDKVVIHKSNIYSMNDSVDIKVIIAMFFPDLIPAPISLAESAIKEKENIDGFFENVRHEPVRNWAISTGNIAAVLRPYQEDAIRFMISREDPDQQTAFMVKDDFVELPTTPPILYSPITGSLSRQLQRPSFGKCPRGISEYLLEKQNETI